MGMHDTVTSEASSDDSFSSGSCSSEESEVLFIYFYFLFCLIVCGFLFDVRCTVLFWH